MALNFTMSVSIIWVNKFAYQQGFRWNTSMTALHFAFTYVGLEICRWYRTDFSWAEVDAVFRKY